MAWLGKSSMFLFKLLPLLQQLIILTNPVGSVPMGPFADTYDESSVTDDYSLVREKRTGLQDSPPTDPIATEKLSGGYTIYKTRVNKNFAQLSWKEAHQVCEQNEGHLANFINKADAEKIIEEIFQKSYFTEAYDWGKETNEFGLDRRYWIGLTDLFEEGKWVWIGRGKALTYTDMWYPGQPDHITPDGKIKSGRHQHCGSFWNPAYWKVDKDKKEKSQRHSFDDLECDRKLYFICERDDKKLEEVKNALSG